MKKHILTLLAVGTLTFSMTAQSFQKMYGVPGGADQQQILGSFLDPDANAYLSGTFRNISVFPEVSFRGAISRINALGDLDWYKSYMPTDFVPMEAYFITSIFEDPLHNIYTFGYYLGMTDESSGYYLQKMSPDGSVLLSRHLQDPQPDMFAKAGFHYGSIYAIMGDRIAHLDPTGGVVSAIEIEGLNARDLTFSSNGLVSVTGELLLNGTYYMPVLYLGQQDLSLYSGFLYASADASSLYADKIIDAPALDRILLCSDGKIVRTSASGVVQIVKQILPQELPDNGLFSIAGFAGISQLEDEFNFAVSAQGFFSDDNSFRNTLITYSMNSACVPISEFKEVAETPLGDWGNVLPQSLLITPDHNSFIASGRIWNSDGSNSLNYAHRGYLDFESCGEESHPLVVDQLPLSSIVSVPFPDSLISTATITATEKWMTVIDIPTGTDETYCEVSLGIEDPAAPSVSIWPNPAQDQLHIEAEGHIGGPVVIRDAAGRNVLNTVAADGTVDVSPLSQGMYVVEMMVDGRKAVVRFVKN